MSQSGRVELIYFNARGRAEVIRLLLAELNIDYLDTRFRDGQAAMEDFRERKEKGELPFDQVPLLKTADGRVIAQSQAILRYLARKHNFEGDSAEIAAEADMITCGAVDLRQRFTTALAADNVCREARGEKFPGNQIPGEFATETLPRWCHFFERILKKNGGDWMCGGQMTYADIAVYDVLSLYSGSPEHLDGFPLLNAMCDRLAARESIARWLAKRPVTVI